MKDRQLEYIIGFALTKGTTADVVRRMAEVGMDVEDFMRMPADQLHRTLGIRRQPNSFGDYERGEALIKAREEAAFTERHGIRVLMLGSEAYPIRLAEIPDAPPVIYMLGDPEPNPQQVLSMVGTRSATPYGAAFCEKSVADLAPYFPGLTIVSGLAYGIDACAHRAALKHGLPTLAVVAHGLDMVYPAAHRPLARSIIENGGAILTEYPRGTKPFRGHFLERNRLVAGLADATVVVESAIKGGAMSTANLAFSYSREVMALPGRVGDTTSAGCNHLIRTQRATLVETATDIFTAAGWKPLDIHIDARQPSLFAALDPDSAAICDALRFAKSDLTADELRQATSLPTGRLIGLLTELEFDGVLMKVPGARYRLM